jgi:murein DD-endopeptidase MepM/ murein hydrolase activator NlpD
VSSSAAASSWRFSWACSEGWRSCVACSPIRIVVAAGDDWPDRTRIVLAVDAVRLQLLRPTIRDGDLRPLAGNHIMVQSGTTVALLAHLRRGSITVARGERVRSGQQLGAVGNSGNSLVPHLHFEVLDGPDPLTARRIPFRIRARDRWTGDAWERVENRPLEAAERVRYVNRAVRTRKRLASSGSGDSRPPV